MKSRFIHTLFVSWVLMLLPAAGRMMAADATNSAAASQPTNAVSRLDLASFKIISQRNIFDPNRRPGTQRGYQLTRTVQVDSFSLRGTMTYENQKVAFFDGSSSQYSKAVTSADSIAGYKIAEIAFDHVKLAASSNQTINMPVGSQMRRQDAGPWSLVEHAEPSPESSAPAASDKPADSAPKGSAPDDVIKRLMQKREQEK